MTPEGHVKQEIKEFLASLGQRCWYYCPVPFGYGRRGIPDFVICYRGFFIAPEAKKPGGKSQAWQEREQERIAIAGGRTRRVSDIDWLKKQIREIDTFWLEHERMKYSGDE